jgi:hypothetical protein
MKILGLRKKSWLLAMALFSVVASAAEKSTKQALEKRPKVQQGEIPEPVVTIRETKQTTVKEYRVNGILRAIKFTPKNGLPAYYLVDREGSGEFVRMGPDVGKEVSNPQWIFFTW